MSLKRGNRARHSAPHVEKLIGNCPTNMFLPFRNLTNRQSAGYGVLCLVLIGGIKWLDANMPVTDPFSAQHDKFAWSDMDEKAKKQQPK